MGPISTRDSNADTVSVTAQELASVTFMPSEWNAPATGCTEIRPFGPPYHIVCLSSSRGLNTAATVGLLFVVSAIWKGHHSRKAQFYNEGWESLAWLRAHWLMTPVLESGLRGWRSKSASAPLTASRPNEMILHECVRPHGHACVLSSSIRQNSIA